MPEKAKGIDSQKGSGAIGEPNAGVVDGNV
jgi:hypothetical protein